MKFSNILGVLLLAMALTACAQNESEQSAAPANVEPAGNSDTQPAAAEASPAEAASSGEEAGSAEAEAPAAASEAPAPQPVQEQPKKEPAAKPVVKATLPDGPEPMLGVDYALLPTPLPLYAGGDKIEIAEIYSYSCIHCFNLNPLLSEWKKTLPDYINVVYVPLVYGEEPADNLARAYFAGEALGVLDRSHDAVFNAFFKERRIQRATPEEFAAIFADIGVDPAKYMGISNSPGMQIRLNRAKQFAQRSGVTTTPTIVVNGKYIVYSTNRGFPAMLHTAYWLAAREQIAK